MLGRRPPGTQTSELGFLPATNKRSKNNDGNSGSDSEEEKASELGFLPAKNKQSKNNDGNSGSDSEEDANLFKNDDEVPKIEEKLV